MKLDAKATIAAQATEIARLRNEVDALAAVNQKRLCARCKLPQCIVPRGILNEMFREICLQVHDYQGARICKGDNLRLKMLGREDNYQFCDEAATTALVLMRISKIPEVKLLNKTYAGVVVE